MKYAPRFASRGSRVSMRAAASATTSFKNKHYAFTLIELAIVVMILALLAAAALRYAATTTDANNVAVTNANLDVVEAALINFRLANNRLPCPSSINGYAENSANFGVEAATPGTCTGGTPAATFSNPLGGGSTTDPDGASPYASGVTGSGNNGGSADPLYDAGSVNQIVGGGIPAKTLRLADKYAYDAWGNAIVYAVDKRMTSTNAFLIYPATTTGAGNPGAIVVKQNWNDALSSAKTYAAVYALVSFGKSGHGAYVRNLNNAPSAKNAGITNTDMLKNCHCNSSGTANTYWDRIFVQKARTANSSTLTDTFDDIVRFKTRPELSSSIEMQ